MTSHTKQTTRAIINRRTFLKGSGGAALLSTGSALLPTLAAAEDSPNTSLVESSTGVLRGKIIDGINTFKGIPYAAPPIGKNRFLAPQAADDWKGVRDAFEYGHYAFQSNRQRGAKQLKFFAPLGYTSVKTPGSSEDCLTLNVWSQGINDAGK